MIQIVLSLGITFCEEGRLLCSLLTFCQLVGISWPSKQETLPNSFITSKPKLFLTLWWLFSRSVESYSATPWTAAHQASLSFTISRSLLKLTSTESVMPSNHLILCRPFSSCPQSFPASESFPMSCLFASGGQGIGASAMNLFVYLSNCFFKTHFERINILPQSFF